MEYCMGTNNSNNFRNFECSIKMTKGTFKKSTGKATRPAKYEKAKSGFGHWKMYVKYLMKKNPGVALKKLITGYDKKEYERFKKNPKLFV